MEKKYYNGIYRGVVMDINDPLKLGRCKIRVPSIHGNLQGSDINLLPWARYISPLPTGSNKGMYILPEINDVVWLFFEGGDKSYPVYIGSSYGVVNEQNEAPISDNDDINSTEVLYSSKDTNGFRASIRKDSKSLTIEFGGSYISIDPNGDINIVSNGNINLKGVKINLN